MTVLIERDDAIGLADGVRPATPAYAIAPGDRFQGTLNTFNDSDFLSTVLEAGYGYVFTLAPQAGAGLSGAYVSIFDGRTASLFASAYNYTEGLLPARLVFSVNPADLPGSYREEGPWHVEIRGNGSISGNAGYALSMIREVGNDRFTQALAQVGTAFTSRLDYAAVDLTFTRSQADVDVVAFNLDAGISYTVALSGANMSLVLQDRLASTPALGSDTSLGDGRAEITFTPTQSGRYLAVIEGVTGDVTGGYSLLVTTPGRILTGDGRPDSLTGGPGDDTIAGQGGNDTLGGAGGNDRIDGGPGNDRILAGDGSDTVIGGPGDDIIFGGDSAADLRDVIYAGAGNDRVDAGHGNDLVYGGDGNDTIEGGFGVDEIIGQSGDDVLAGSAFSDLIFGGAGSDFINGGFGSDRVNGGTGADRFYHLGIADHGSDWVQDYSSAEGDRLVFGGAGVRSQFQVNFAQTQGAGAAGVDEAFVIYRPTGQILWALVDGEAQGAIVLDIGGQVFDLLS
jgi:Ca2+-binding RTX toxin-like protein